MGEASNRQPRLAELMRAKAWVAKYGGQVFPTWGSFEWFLRTHPEVRRSSGWHELHSGSFVDHELFEPDLLRALGVAQAA